MFNISDQTSKSSKANAETLVTLGNTALASAERLAALNLNTARSLWEDGIALVPALFGVKNPQAFVALQSTLAQPVAEKAVAYSRSVYAIMTETQGEVARVVESQFAESSALIAGALDKAAKNGPAGSDVAIAAVKSAIAAANSAYDNMTKATRQVVDITEANVSAATNATVKAVGSAAAKAKKAA